MNLSVYFSITLMFPKKLGQKCFIKEKSERSTYAAFRKYTSLFSGRLVSLRRTGRASVDDVTGHDDCHQPRANAL